MKNWNNWLARGKVTPYFQPILSVENQKIFGYEVLGRLILPNGQVESLGPLFNATLPPGALPEEKDELEALKRETDRDLRLQALSLLGSSEDRGFHIFFNISPSQMYRHLTSGTTEPPFTMQIIRESGFPPERVIIEITEERFDEELEALEDLLSLYRTEGFRVAVDDVGSESSNLDRIGLFHPDIIKVDLQLLRRSIYSRSFKEILVHLARLGESVGSALLFEGIETSEELHHAMETGARYLQGFFFSEALPHILPPDPFQDLIVKGLDLLLTRSQTSIHHRVTWEDQILSVLERFPLGVETSPRGDLSLNCTMESHEASPIYRIYLTDAKGYQLTPNLVLSPSGKFISDPASLGKNWSTRPYFFDHIYQSRSSEGPVGHVTNLPGCF